MSVKICVFLLSENGGAWKSVQAEHIQGEVFKILDQPYDRSDEKWEFEPGTTVVCEPRRYNVSGSAVEIPTAVRPLNNPNYKRPFKTEDFT